jgi:hypothetical protein
MLVLLCERTMIFKEARKMNFRRFLIPIFKEFFSSLEAEEIMDLFGGKARFIYLLLEIFKNLDEGEKEDLRNEFFGEENWDALKEYIGAWNGYCEN